MTLNRLSLSPVFVPGGTTIVDLWWSQTAAGTTGSVVRLGIYACDPTFAVPGALLLDTGGQDATGSNVDKTVSITAIPVNADSVLFVGGVAQVAAPSVRPTFPTVATSIPWVPYTGWFQALNGNQGFGFRQDAVSGALPSTFNAVSYSVAGTVNTGAQIWVGLQVQ